MLPIKGLQKMSLIDFPPHTSCVVFIGGCNFRCPYCQNPDLVLGFENQPTIPDKEIFEFLLKRKEWLDAVVITGGEPTLYTDLIPFIETIKSMDYKVKLDTNGSNPELLEKLLPMLDHVAMDIKAPLKNYNDATTSEVISENIQKSIDLIRGKAKDYEFRTTVVPRFFKEDDAIEIGKWLKGSKRFIIQQFRTNMPMLDKSFKDIPYEKEELVKFKDVLKDYFDEVKISME